MFANKRLSAAYKSAKIEYFDENSKYIFFSDSHRGDDSASDEFTRNQNVLSSISVIRIYLFFPSYVVAAAFRPYSKDPQISLNLRCSQTIANLLLFFLYICNINAIIVL